MVYFSSKIQSQQDVIANDIYDIIASAFTFLTSHNLGLTAADRLSGLPDEARMTYSTTAGWPY